MTYEQKIKYMEIAAGICHLGFNERHLDLLVSIYEGVIEKEGDFSVRDAVEIMVDVDNREKKRLIENKSKEEANN